MRTLLIAACCALPLLAADGPKAIAPITPIEMVRRALADYTRDEAAERQYTYLQREDFRMLDGSGNLKRRDLHTYDVTLLEGSPYRRLVKRNDQPLPPEEEKQQQANLQRSIDERRKGDAGAAPPAHRRMGAETPGKTKGYRRSPRRFRSDFWRAKM